MFCCASAVCLQAAAGFSDLLHTTNRKLEFDSLWTKASREPSPLAIEPQPQPATTPTPTPSPGVVDALAADDPTVDAPTSRDAAGTRQALEQRALEGQAQELARELSSDMEANAEPEPEPEPQPDADAPWAYTAYNILQRMMGPRT